MPFRTGQALFFSCQRAITFVVDQKFNVRDCVLEDLVAECLRHLGSLPPSRRQDAANVVPPEVLAFIERSTKLCLFGAYSAVEGWSARIPGWRCEYLDASVPSSTMEFMESIAHTEGLGLWRFMCWFSLDLFTIARLRTRAEVLRCDQLDESSWLCFFPA